jgi:hypothetical protein
MRGNPLILAWSVFGEACRAGSSIQRTSAGPVAIFTSLRMMPYGARNDDRLCIGIEVPEYLGLKARS